MELVEFPENTQQGGRVENESEASTAASRYYVPGTGLDSVQDSSPRT